MEADKYIPTSSVATAKSHLTIHDLDDDSLGMIFNMLPHDDRARIESICQRWYAISKANWCTYCKHLRIGDDTDDFLPSYDNTTEMENILDKILQGPGPYLEEITFKKAYIFCQQFPMGTIKWIAEFCPKLKRLNTSSLRLNKDDWLSCSNLEALSFTALQKHDLGVLFRINKRLRRLEIFGASWLRDSDFNELDPGQLVFLQIEYCSQFELTGKLADKLAESLVNLKYTNYSSVRSNLQHLVKLKNLQSLDLKVGMEWLKIEFIHDIASNCRKIECLFLAIRSDHAYNENVFEPIFDLPYLRKLVILVAENEMPCEERDKLLQRATHLEFFVIDTCAKCKHASYSFQFCDRHRRYWIS